MSEPPARCLRTPFADSDVSFSNFVGFSAVKVLEGGRCVRFRYPSGFSYDVPLRYLLSWFARPHFALLRGRWRDVSAEWPRNTGKATASGARRTMGGLAVRIYLTNQRALEVAWDTVLMACEPAYEHFGGLTPEGRQNALRHWRAWSEQWFGRQP
jgi:hypothetical protein